MVIFSKLRYICSNLNLFKFHAKVVAASAQDDISTFQGGEAPPTAERAADAGASVLAGACQGSSRYRGRAAQVPFVPERRDGWSSAGAFCSTAQCRSFFCVDVMLGGDSLRRLDEQLSPQALVPSNVAYFTAAHAAAVFRRRWGGAAAFFLTGTPACRLGAGTPACRLGARSPRSPTPVRFSASTAGELELVSPCVPISPHPLFLDPVILLLS